MRALIAAILFVFAMDAVGQAIPRFLFRPIVRPYDYRPVRGPNKYNKDKNGSTDSTTLTPGFKLNGTWWAWQDPLTGQLFTAQGAPALGRVLVNWFSMPGVDQNGVPVDGNQTSGSWSNRRITRWSTTTPGGSTLVNSQSNPNLRLVGRVNNGINWYGAPQRRMIDDQNRSRSYVIPPNFTGGAVNVRPQYLGYLVTDYGENDGSPPAPNGDWPNKIWLAPNPITSGVPAPSGARGTTGVSTQLGIAGEWINSYFWYDFNVRSQDRAGLEGLKDFSLAGLPMDVLLPATGTNDTSLAAIGNRSPNVGQPVSIQMGYMIKCTRTSAQVPMSNPARFFWNNYTYTRVPIGTDGINDTTSSLAQYNRGANGSGLGSGPPGARTGPYALTRLFGNYVVVSGVFSGNQGNTNNAGNFTFNPSAMGNVSSTRSMSTMLQYGSLHTKLRMMMRMPALGPEYLFLNLQNPTFNGRANIMQ